MAAQDAASLKEHSDAQTAEQPPGQTQLAPHQELIQRASNPPAHVTSSYLDGVLHYVDSFEHDGSWGEAADRVGRDAMVGGANAVANIGDAVVGAVQDEAHVLAHPQEAALEAEDPAMANRMRWVGDERTPSIWQHAKNAILDFRDHMQLQDPNGVDKMTQIGAQLAIPFMGASKLLEGIQIAALERAPAEVSAMQDFGPYLAKTAARDATMVAQKAGRFVKNVAVPGAMVDGTALQPHASRMVDTLALLRQTEGRFGEALRTVAPDGGLIDHYIHYLTERDDESEAEGRFKNILDGAGVNAALSGLLGAVAPVLKQGTAGLRYLADNGVVSGADFPRPASATQAGKIVFHGTPHDFDEFDSSKIGTGEGNQTFGHGLYFAESPDVAGSYAAAVSNHKLSPEDLKAYYQPGAVRTSIGGSKDKILSYDPEKGYVTVERTDPSMPGRPQKVTFGHNSADWVRVRRALGQPLQKSGQVFKVDIPDEHIAKMVDWDQSISAQPKLQQALRDLNVTVQPEGNRWRVMVDGKPGPQYLTRQAALSETDLLRGESPNVDAGMAYNQLAEALRGQKAASKYLASKGITGIRYLDAGSRDAKTGTRNIVLFDAKQAKILSKGEKPRA